MEAGLPTDFWKQNTDDYLGAAKALFHSMNKNGFDPRCAVPIDPTGELLNGSHRVACALALEIETIMTVSVPQNVWAPAWDEGWFIMNGADRAIIDELKQEIGLAQ